MPVIHFSFAGDGGAGRAGRRASQACAAVGVSSTFAYVEGQRTNASDICFEPTATGASRNAEILGKGFTELQWRFIPARRTPNSDTLLSTAYPGIDVAYHPAFTTTDIIHLHWPTWGVTPATIRQWLDSGRHVFWTLHDAWAMTGGCHYPNGCQQYATQCLKCPQLQDDLGLISANFVDKLESYGAGGNLHIITPSAWLAEEARRSRILADRPIHVVRNCIELDVFAPQQDRRGLRASFGLEDEDFLIFFGSYDLQERRKGVRFLLDALAGLGSSGALSAALPSRGRVFLASVGRSSAVEKIEGTFSLDFGHINDDEVMADVLGVADLVCVPSLEDNYPNIIVEAMACGTPVLGTPVGGVPEMFEDGISGLIASEAASADALAAALLRFVRNHHGSRAMREAARALTERINDPLVVGERLRTLYEAALGRPFAETTQSLRSRMSRVFAKAPVHGRVPDGGDLLRFPTNMALLRQLPDERTAVQVTAALAKDSAAGRHRLMTVRTYHGHHSARSGPYQYVRHLDHRRFDASHVAVPLGTELAGDHAETYRRAGIVLGTKAFGQQGNAWVAEADILLRCATKRFDIVHFIDGELGGWLLPSLPPALFKDGQRPAIVTTFHQPKAILSGLINPTMLRDYDAIIALCASQRDFLANYKDPDSIFLVPHGIDTDFFSPSPANYVRPVRAGFQVLLIGQWLRDLTVALDAFQLLRSSGVEAELTVISPTFPPKYRRTGVTVKSGVSDEDLRDAYWNADVVFIPLKDATANNALLEAMACGCPVISTDVGGVREGVGEQAGILCPLGNVAAHAEALLVFARSAELRRACGQAGRARALTMDWREAARHHEAVYQAVISRRTVAASSAASGAGYVAASLPEVPQSSGQAALEEPSGTPAPQKSATGPGIRRGERKAAAGTAPLPETKQVEAAPAGLPARRKPCVAAKGPVVDEQPVPQARTRRKSARWG